MRDRQLENQLERLLKYGTLIFSIVIAIGIVLDVFEIELTSPDLVAVGIAGFITLPILRIVTMLGHYFSSRDVAIFRIVAIVLSLVVAGLILGVAL